MSDWTEGLPLEMRKKARALQEKRAAALRAWDGKMMTRDRAREVVAFCNARLEMIAREARV
jgi:hypothetical protein